MARDQSRGGTFEGTRRELLRVAHIVANLTHPFGAVEFNPTSKPGSPDYGLLYTSGSDLGFSNGGGPHANNPGQTQRLDTVIGAILRIDPRSPSVSGGMKGLGDYTIPAINKFAADGDPKTLGEIYAYGFRNAHRLSWDLTDGTMFASDIGMNHIEEINIVREGEQLRLDEARGILRERHDEARRRAQSVASRCRRRCWTDGRRTVSRIPWRSTITAKDRP